jgi:O-antigen/teichoic acid export membrane protein
MSSVKQSFFWAGIEQVGPRAVQALIGVTLARLLEPAAFGLVGMLALFISLAQVFADSGLSGSLIQRKALTPDDETSVWALNIVAGVTLAGLLCLISPLVARFYKQPVLMPMLCVQSLSILISSFSIVQSALLVRAMQFQKTAMIGTVITITGGITGIVMACVGFGVWSLVGSIVSGSLVRSALYWKLSDWRPRGKVRLACVRSMWSFSSYLLYCNLIFITYQNMYAVIIGKFYSPASLGYYDRANNLRMLPVGVMSQVINRVAFPLLSRCHDDKPLLLRRIREIVRGALLLSAGGLTLLAVVADPLVPLLLSEKWRPAIPLFRILCYAGVLYPISGLFLTALQAEGHSNLNFRLESIKMVNGILAIALVYRYGVQALAWSVVVLALIAFFLNAWYNVRLFGYRWRMQAMDIMPAIGLCALSGCTAWWIGNLVLAPAWIVLIVRAGLFLGLWGGGILCLRKVFFDDFCRHVTSALTRFRQKPSIKNPPPLRSYAPEQR